MRFHIAALSCLVLAGTALPVVAHAQFETPSQQELQMTTDPKAPGASAVILDREETTDDPHHFKTIYARIKILSENGLSAATVHIPYTRNYVFHASGDNSSRMGSGDANHWDAPNVNHSGEDQPNDVDSYNVKTDISAIEGRTIHPDGTIVPLTGSPADLLKVKRGRNQVNEVTFTLPSVEVGSIIEYRYQVRYDRFESAADWEIQKPWFTHHAHFMFTPDERFSPARLKAGSAGITNSGLLDANGDILTDIRDGEILPPGATVKNEASGVYTLDVNDIPPFADEPFSPPEQGRAYRVQFAYVANPDLKDYWQKQMSFWNKKLNQYIEPTQALKSAVQEAIAGATTDLDKAKKLYEFTSRMENIDGTPNGDPGIGSEWIPAGHVDQVLLDKKGTSNQIAYLYLGMARIAGLNAHPERIASRSVRFFSPKFRDPGQLDTVVIALNLDGKDITVDPGTKMAPFQTLHWAHAAAPGLALNNGKVDSIITPEQKVTDNLVLHVGSLAITPQGGVSGTVKVAFLGQQAIRLRQMALGNADATKGEMERMIAQQVPSGVEARIDRVAYMDDPTRQFVAVVNISGTLGSPAGGRILLPRNFFSTREGNPYPEDDARTNPVDVQYPAEEQDQITYVLPAGFTIEGKPEDAVMKWESNAAYELKAKLAPNSFTSTRILARGFTLLEPKDYSGLRDFYQKVVTADQQQIVLAPAAQAAN
ncbi:MAG TPA: DUF3857 domain-containing protein [Terracidiphilus sp.]|nr:DUF3857 domain-containing protein [Terracidiphilus sp.]